MPTRGLGNEIVNLNALFFSYIEQKWELLMSYPVLALAINSERKS